MAKKSQKQTAVNEVPLSETLQEAADKFLLAVRRNKWDAADNDNLAEAFVIVFRTNGEDGGVNVNILNQGLGDELQNLMANAALKAIDGKPLFYTLYPKPDSFGRTKSRKVKKAA